AGAMAVFERHTSGQTAEQRRPVGGPHRIGVVAEVDLELPRADLGGDHRGVDALQTRGLADVIEHVGKARQALDMHVRLVIGVTAQIIARVLRQTVLERLVEQVELQLEGHHRTNTARGQALYHAPQHLTRFELDGRVGTVGADQHLPQRLALPVHQLERAGNQPPRCIRITIVETVVTDFVEPALGTEQHAVLRQLQGAASGDLLQHLDRIALAIKVPGNVQADQVYEAHLGVGIAELADFVEQIDWGGVHCDYFRFTKRFRYRSTARALAFHPGWHSAGARNSAPGRHRRGTGWRFVRPRPA